MVDTRLLGRVARPVRRLARTGQVRPGLLTVIVAAQNVEDYLEAALRSILDQSYRRLEVLVVDDGSSDRTGAVAEGIAAADVRVRVFHRRDLDVNAARNFALSQANGYYITFLDGDDLLVPGAYDDMVLALERHDTDFVVGCYDRIEECGTRPAARWINSAHKSYRGRTTVSDFPDVMVNVVPWSKLYRRSFWQAAVGEFELGGHRRDQPASAHVYCAAHAFTVLPRVVAHWRVRGDGSSMTQQLFDPGSLRDRFDRGGESIAIYRSSAGDRLADIRFAQYLNHDIAEVATRLGNESDAFWADFRTRLHDFVDDASPAAWARVHSKHRVHYRLILDGRRDLAVEYRSGMSQVRVEDDFVQIDGQVYVKYPFWDRPDSGVPRSDYLASPGELNRIRKAMAKQHKKVLTAS